MRVTNSNKWIKERMKKLRIERGNECVMKSEYCEGQLEFAHIAPTTISGMGRGRKERVYDIIRNPKSYTLLCRKHHLEYDANEYDLPEVIKEIEQ
jgi:hypothetical protein